MMRAPLAAAALLCAAPAAFADGDDAQGLRLGDVGAAASDAVRQTRDGLGEAAMAPLEDLNLRGETVPPVLAAIEDPFAPLPYADCPGVAAAIAPLEAELAPPEPAESLPEKAADKAAGEALKTVASQARELIPYRGLVRKATGADRRAKAVRTAYEKGAQRLAYLKGVGAALGCRSGSEADTPRLAAHGAPREILPPVPEPPEYIPAPPPPPAKRAPVTPAAPISSPPTATTAPREAPETAPRRWPPEG